LLKISKIFRGLLFGAHGRTEHYLSLLVINPKGQRLQGLPLQQPVKKFLFRICLKDLLSANRVVTPDNRAAKDKANGFSKLVATARQLRL